MKKIIILITTFIIFSLSSCKTNQITFIQKKHDNGNHFGWFKNPHNPHNPNYKPPKSHNPNDPKYKPPKTKQGKPNNPKKHKK